MVIEEINDTGMDKILTSTIFLLNERLKDMVGITKPYILHPSH